MLDRASKPPDSKNLPLDTDNKDQLLLGWDVEGAILLRQTSETDLLTLLVAVLLHVLLSTLEDDTTLLLLGLIDNVSIELINL